MNSPRPTRRLLVSLASLMAFAALSALPAHGASPPAAESAGRSVGAPASRAAAAVDVLRRLRRARRAPAVDAAKWQIETGDNVNNHERQYYTAGTDNAALDGQGHLVITARQENPGNYQLLVRHAASTPPPG